MLPAVATPRLQMKVRAMMRPNKVSEIRSIGSSTCTKGISEAADIKSNIHWLDLQEPILPAMLADGANLHNTDAEHSIEGRNTIECWTPSARNKSRAAPESE